MPLLRPLHNGDGLEIGTQELRYSGPEVSSGQTAVLRLRDKANPGEAVRRTEDESQLDAARQTYAGEALNQALKIPFDAFLTAYPGKDISLTVTDRESSVTVTGELGQPAQKKALDEEAARNALVKTGGTPFALNQLTVQTAGTFVPASALNALRREALDKLAEAPRETVPAAHFDIPRREIPAPRLLVKTQSIAEIASLISAGADEVLFLPQDFREESLVPLLQSNAFLGGKARLCLPSQLSENTQKWLEALCNENNIPVCLSTPNQLSGGFAIGDMAGEGIPAMNGEALRLLSSLGCKSVTLSRELSQQEILDLPTDICSLILPVYGRARLMVLNHCPMRTQLGLKTGREHCDLCRQGKGALGTCLKDRMDAEYPLLPLRLPEGCQIELMADKPLHLSGRLSGMNRFSWLLTFTDEAVSDRLEITAHYAALLQGETPKPVSVKGVLGRFRDGVL